MQSPFPTFNVRLLYLQLSDCLQSVVNLSMKAEPRVSQKLATGLTKKHPRKSNSRYSSSGYAASGYAAMGQVRWLCADFLS